MSIKKMKLYAQLRYAGDETIPARTKILFDQLAILHANLKETEQHIEFVEDKIQTYLATLTKSYNYLKMLCSNYIVFAPPYTQINYGSIIKIKYITVLII